MIYYFHIDITFRKLDKKRFKCWLSVIFWCQISRLVIISDSMSLYLRKFSGKISAHRNFLWVQGGGKMSFWN